MIGRCIFDFVAPAYTEELESRLSTVDQSEFNQEQNGIEPKIICNQKQEKFIDLSIQNTVLAGKKSFNWGSAIDIYGI